MANAVRVGDVIVKLFFTGRSIILSLTRGLTTGLERERGIMNVTDKIAIVTGGGRGIGRGISLVLARKGADIVVADLVEDNARGVANEVRTGQAINVSGGLLMH